MKKAQKKGATDRKAKPETNLKEMRLTVEIDRLETKVETLEQVVAKQAEIVDFVYRELQIKGILPNVISSAMPRIPLVAAPKSIPSQATGLISAGKVVEIAHKSHPRSIHKLKPD